MKIKHILSAIIIPCILFLASFKKSDKIYSIETLSQKHGKNHDNDNYDKDKGNKKDNHKKHHDYGNDGNYDRHENDRHGNKHQKQIDKFYSKGNKKYYGNNGHGNGNDHWKNKTYKNRDNWDNNKWNDDKWDNTIWDDDRFETRMRRLKTFNRNRWVNNTFYPGIVWFNVNGKDYNDIKPPKENKKVTMCHKPKSSDFPVMITVSENAVKAHLNHGDYLGECKDFDRSKYSDNYWDARKDYYNQYTTTTETLSFGEQLLVLALSKLTNAKAQMVPLRITLQEEELKRKEAALIKLQNDVYNLQSSLNNSNEKVGLQVNVTY